MTKPLDVAFFLDGSDRIKKSTFDKMKDFIKGVLQAYDIAKNKTRVSIATFAETQNKIVNLKEGAFKSVVYQAIEDAGALGGKRQLEDAVKYAETGIFEKNNRGKLVVLLVNGSPSSKDTQDRLEALLRGMKGRGINVVLVAIGETKNDEELRGISKETMTILVPDSKDIRDAYTTVLDASKKAAGIRELIVSDAQDFECLLTK